LDTSNIIALVALVVAVLALPTSYFVATRQVKVGLDEHENRNKNRTRILVAERLDEFVSLFFSATQQFSGIDLRAGKYDQDKLKSAMPEIDSEVIKTGILERLAKTIDDYVNTGEADGKDEGDVAKRLQLIRGMISRGSNPPELFATWNLLNVCQGNDLSKHLRTS
jgi:TPP-dependent indolepyruvate ferredoxin oxidoreductase alpha subunit